MAVTVASKKTEIGAVGRVPVPGVSRAFGALPEISVTDAASNMRRANVREGLPCDI